MSNVDFEEQKYTGPDYTSTESKMGWFHKALIKMHIAKDAKSANIASVIIIVVCLILTFILVNF